ncbi:hypothetical protein AA103196_0773 [Ameyamaea chiangmaiensis NBRC 103196]|uniref:YigZ family protein n=1 Tax=Ameyamaea chiangmaiensis TaxID=442969 RepID=A0A850P9I9_9PROT|nr:YigZ family protein [Ameyamaea chiangmaiensis]MBS4075876.1 YigZ family protein [Ameyamaea chiangmaiensis]NVN41237.1 YigZ family protein [Ameyamaea chiangmaiensis]GBQ64065.1 hypothetical protein AA103196_0773 [Ameyamaea chiangmaiensis NBRC 103196]
MTRHTLTGPSSFEQDIRRSLFRAEAAPVTSADEALAFVRTVSIPDATHNCWAFRIGQTYRSDDDGEPGGTAGRPILTMIDGQAMDQVAVVVTRWFGGTKLGAGGLVRAYGGTAAECLRRAEKIPLIAMTQLGFHAGFADHARLQARLRDWGAEMEAEQFDAFGARCTLRAPSADIDILTTRIVDLTAGRVVPRPVD